MHVVCQYRHVQVSLHFMEPRWPNIFIQEGVWSNPVIHRDRVSTPEYCWCIASHCYACCLPIQACTSEPSFHGVKMAEYLHPGRGVVKPSDPLRQCEHSRVLLVYSLTLLYMLSVNTGMYKWAFISWSQDGRISSSRKGCGQTQWSTETEWALQSTAGV